MDVRTYPYRLFDAFFLVILYQGKKNNRFYKHGKSVFPILIDLGKTNITLNKLTEIMKSIPFINQVIERDYSHFDEERKRGISIYLILNFMMILVMGSWVVGFWILEMPEMFYLDGAIFIGYISLFIGVAFFKFPFNIGRFILLFFGALITAFPVLFYGIDTSVSLHLVFLPIATILLFSRKEGKLFLKYLAGILTTFIIVAIWSLKYGAMYQVSPDTFRIFNTIVALDGMFISLYFSYFFFSENAGYKDLLANEREKSDHLLLSIFPEKIADQLRHSNQSVADSFDNVTILFADIVGFTQYSNSMSPSELVHMLDEVFSEFDALVDKYGIEKIKTIGDAYMAVGGLPTPDERHCHNVADLALEINQIIKVKYDKKYNLKLRIGIHTGKAVAGVIGNKKFSYDLWGDSVNIASRFESGGQPERVHITEAVKNILGDSYEYEYCGEVDIKGKGMMKSYFLEGKIENKTALLKEGQSTLAIAS